MKKVLTICLLFVLFACNQSKNSTVLVAILARNKAHTLPKYLECIENLDFDKKAITIYINTNNNTDDTEQILQTWVDLNRDAYKKIIFESHHVEQLADDPSNPHEWNSTRFSILGQIRQKSMEATLRENCDYYFVADCDNFVAPLTLKKLIVKNKPIIAPMLETIPGPKIYSNYFCDIDENGYWKVNPFYFEILNRNVRGTFPVPVVHCTYLIRADQILNLTYLDGTNDYEFVIFSRSARNHGVQQCICNEEHFGYLFLPDDATVVGHIDLETEREIFKNLEVPHLY